MTQDLNVAEVADKFLTELEKVGKFNNVPVLQIQRECTWTEKYAVFVLQFDTYIPSHHNNEYITTDFDEYQFDKDFMKVLKKVFPKCKIDYNRNCSEYQITAPGYKKWQKEHSESIEKWVEEHEGWSVYGRTK